MVLKLHGIYRSPWVSVVATVLLEKQVPFELIPVDLVNGENKSPEYLAKQPFGQVPYIDDDGFILYESRAICYYIASKYANQGTPLLPTGIQANALFQQAVSVESSHYHPHGFLAAKELMNHGRTETFEKYITDFSGKLDVYDKILSKQKYLAGDEITLADFYHLPVGSVLANLGSNVMESKPNVARWFKDVSSRESWVSTQEVEKN